MNRLIYAGVWRNDKLWIVYEVCMHAVLLEILKITPLLYWTAYKIWNSHADEYYGYGAVGCNAL